MKKVLISEDMLKGGKADKLSIPDIAKKHKVPVKTILQQIVKGLSVEQEHTNSPAVTYEIVLDHLTERPDYYSKLAKMEDQPIELSID